MSWVFNPFTTNFDYYQASSGNLTTDSFTSSAGSQDLTLSNTPTAVLLVVLNGQFLAPTEDYTTSGAIVTLINPNIPAGLNVTVLYNY